MARLWAILSRSAIIHLSSALCVALFTKISDSKRNIFQFQCSRKLWLCIKIPPVSACLPLWVHMNGSFLYAKTEKNKNAAHIFPELIGIIH